MTYTSEQVRQATGLTERQLGHLIRRGAVRSVDVDNTGSGRARVWSRQAFAQALTYAKLDCCNDEHRATGARVLGAIGDLDALRGLYLVITERAVSVVHDIDDLTRSGDTFSVLKLDEVLDAIPESVDA